MGGEDRRKAKQDHGKTGALRWTCAGTELALTMGSSVESLRCQEGGPTCSLVPQTRELRPREVDPPAQCHFYKLRAEPRPCPRISVYLPLGSLPRSGLLAACPGPPAAAVPRNRAQECSFPPPGPGHCGASRHQLRLGGWLHPRSALLVRPGACPPHRKAQAL